VDVSELLLMAALMTADLSAYTWKNRVLLLFAPSKDHPALREQKDRIAARMLDFADRDLVAIEAIEEPELRKRFRAGAAGFTVILVGKDGSAKMRRSEPVAMDDIFSLIDGMPMRRAEVEAKKEEPAKPPR
jgi:hypothetical protein